MVAISTLIGLAVSVAITVVTKVVLPLLFPPQRASAQATIAPQVQSTTPRPSDGKYNLKQNVPSLTVVLGRVKKGSDYVFLEETQGAAFHVLVVAGHRIEGFVQHYLHDEVVTLDENNWVVGPEHFDGQVRISTLKGTSNQTAWSTLVGFFPTIWTNDHRGIGLANILMECLTVAEEYYLDVYPQQMPVHTCVLDGAHVYDPREESHDPDDPDTWEFSTNLALLRLFHLTHPSGGRLSFDDMYLPDWENAADVCDELVLNRNGEEENRYHGGLWYRYDQDQVEVGRILDQAGELVVYERADGKIGVHAGELITPDITITENDIKELQYDANRRAANTVLAVRGRWTDPWSTWNTADAAIYGDPYTGDDDTQRTKTVDNQAVQRHNHIQRLQKLAFIRANAARVKLTIDYDAESNTRNVTYRRFVRVDYPARGLDEAIIEITGRPRLDLSDLTITFEGIVVPPTLYSFNASTEEGVAGGQAANVTPTGVPVPTGFAIGIGSEIIAGGQSAAFALGAWDHLSDALTYELEYQLSDASESPRSVMSKPGETEARTGYLQDLAEYRFRLRAWSNGAASAWTSYETATALADTNAPGQPTNFASNKVGSDVELDWYAPNSPNLYKTELYRNGVDNFATATLIATLNGGINEPRNYDDESLANGTYYWWVRAVNASGIPSAEVGPETQTIP